MAVAAVAVGVAGADAPAGVGRAAASKPLKPDVLARGAVSAARALLGAWIRSTVGGEVVVARIVETEAYLGPEDPASHASTRGITPRNRAMFGPAGRAYVYRSHGIHWCFNVVTGGDGEGEAVLIRGGEILEGEAVALDRRGGRRPLAAGPGRLGQALGIGPEHYGLELASAPLELLPGEDLSDEVVGVSGRVGIRHASEWPLRFYVEGSPGVSRVRVSPGDIGALPPHIRSQAFPPSVSRS